MQTCKRNQEGRFVVSLPIREELLQKLGNSRDIAIKRFSNLERKFQMKPQLRTEYKRFIHEYLQLQHMKEIKETDATWDVQPQYYMPHHCIIKESSNTTKLRVVFDASSRSNAGIALNDALMVGPVLQQDLFSILLRFRRFKYVMTADIAKMYRQIVVEDKQTPLQRIVWRDNPSDNIKTYELLTLTYGTAPASFLATKVIEQLAIEEEDQFPTGSRIARRDFYMDDLLTGADSMEEALKIRDQTTSLLAKGGFVLREWASNNINLLRGMPEDAISGTIMELDKEGLSRTLGVGWNHVTDQFRYAISMENRVSYTKRSIVSSISQIFDPLGLLAPVILKAKLFIQELWKLRISWDEPLPDNITKEWSGYVRRMKELDGFTVRRRMFGEEHEEDIELHGFCDASATAYGACIYLRHNDAMNGIQINLMCAKTRVAPIKTISIPRLELCGAQLLAQLMQKTKMSTGMNVKRICYWSDSSIVIHWIRAVNKRLPVFVAHRVGEIQELSAVEDWRHVKSDENAADILSRGCKPEDLKESSSWWNGPAWLRSQSYEERRGEPEIVEEEQSEDETRVVAVTVMEQANEIIIKFSSLQKLLRVVAICFRFARRCKKQLKTKLSQALTDEDLEHAKRCVVGMEQRRVFGEEFKALQRNKTVARNSALRQLSPWIDETGLIRVGGRLQNAEIQQTAKHPWVLPHKSKLVELIIEHEHKRNLHAGVETTMAAVRQLYWPIRARGTVRKVIHGCVRCFRTEPRASQQIMGNLPSSRVIPARSFDRTGVDFCGPIWVRESARRGSKRVKTYVAVFVCMVTKALHLELVSNMSTEAFIGAFKRFIGRRGRPSEVFSDNGTNFVGANRELSELKDVFSEELSARRIINCTAPEGIKWHFIPARAPHFGGLWESAVKSFKKYFYKIASEAVMTFEEATTLTTQIEAILNSRPLTALSSDPNDFDYLTPGYFLIGCALNSYPEPNLDHLKINSLSRWQMIERMRQQFWKRWSTEYLTKLQVRNKWQVDRGPSCRVGQLVICKEENVPPMQWPLGRIQEVFPGDDGKIRVVVIRTASGTYKRPAAKICILPLEKYVNDESTSLIATQM